VWLTEREEESDAGKLEKRERPYLKYSFPVF
jgi:hypothetical protein